MGRSDSGEGIYEFEGFSLDASKRLVSGPAGETIPLMPKAYEILFVLVKNSHRVVEKDELMSAVWPDTAVEENNLTQNISALRRALGERHRENRFIATVPGRGYKFVAEVTGGPTVNEAEDASQADARPERTFGGYRAAAIGFVVLLGMASLAFVIWRSSSTSVPAEIRSLAVLPFKPLTSDRRDESLELGMADALITKLGSDERVLIRPISAVRRFTALEQDPADAGRQLQVDAVLDGNIQIAGDRIRVSVKLFRVSDARQLWAGQFDEDLTDIFAVQDSIAQRVATALDIRLGTDSKKVPTESIEAYQLYMRGKLHSRRLVRSEVEKGIGYYDEALRLDPRFALAYVELANAYRALVLTSDYRPADYFPKAKRAAEKAVELDPTLAEAWSSLAISDFWFDWNWASAEANHLRALELDPYSVQSRLFYAHLLSNLGRHDEALGQVKQARERDPANVLTNAIEGQVLFFAGQTDASERVLRATIDLEPNFWLAHLFITRVYLAKEDFENAIASGRRAVELSGGNAEALASVGYGLARSGKTQEARAMLTELQDRAKSRYVPSYAIAQIYAGLDERQAALDHLEKAFVEHDAPMVFLKVEPKWDGLRSEPRFAKLMREMNFSE